MRRFIIASAILSVVASVHAAENSASLRTCPFVPDPTSNLAQHAARFTGWLGCYRERVSSPGWDGLVFDRGVIADTTGTTKVRITSYAVSDLVWAVITPLGPIAGDGEMQTYTIGGPLGKAVADLGGIGAVDPPKNFERSSFDVDVGLVYTVPEQAGGGTGTMALPKIALTYTPYQVDLGVDLDATTTAQLESVWKPRARERILAYSACSKNPRVAFTLQAQGGEGFGSVILAALEIANSNPNFKCEIDEVIGEPRTLLQQVDDALAQSRQAGLPGTTMDEVPGCKREGEYDTALWALVRAMAQYPHLVSEATRNHVLTALFENYDGRYVDDPSYTNEGFCGMQVPETENHILLLESSRYLFNELKQKAQGASPSPRLDNGANGQRQWLLEHLNLLANGGFYEYNAIPYQRYAYYALANLADLTSEGDPVKTAARLLIRYLDAKFVLGSIDLRRNAALRRRNESDIASSQTFFSLFDDIQAARWAYFAGSSVSLDNVSWPEQKFSANNRDFRAMHWWHSQSAAIAVLTSQQPPEFLTSLVWSRAAHPYFQAYTNQGAAVPKHFTMGKSGYEIYWKDISFMIAAGGERVPHGYDVSQFPPTGGTALVAAPALIAFFNAGPLGAAAAVLGFDKLREQIAVNAAEKQNVGIARPTVLLPARSATRRDEMLRFLGAPSSPRNSCVGPNFMCGTRPQVPNIFSTIDSCARMTLRDPILQKYWKEHDLVLGCPIFGTEASNGSEHWVTFANGAAAVRYGAPNNVAYFVSALIQYGERPYINLSFKGPGRDFHIVKYRVPGAEKETQTDLGRGRGYQVTDITYQIPAEKGSYSIAMEGCYFGAIDSNCPDGWIASLNFEIRDSDRLTPAPLVCSAQIPEQRPSNGNIAIVQFGTRVGNECRNSLVAGIFVSPCEDRAPMPDSAQCVEAGGNYGFAEVISSTGRDEDVAIFADSFAQRVANKLFRFDNQPQSLTLTDGSTISFVFHPSNAMSWAITSLNTTKIGAASATSLSTDMRTWPRAVGEYMNYANSVYTIRNPLSNQIWTLDARNANMPVVTPE